MRKIIYIALVLLFAGCNSENSWDCIQSAGDIVVQEISVAPFTKILVRDRIKLYIEQGDQQKVRIETGENLMSSITATVVDGKLEVLNKYSCNLVQDYGITKVYITAPDITEIRSSTGYTIESIGVLSYRSLTLLSEDEENEDEFQTDGDFKLSLAVENLNIVANGLSKFYLNGTANFASFGLYASDARIYSEDLVVETLYIFQRSTGDMVVNPNLAIRGKIVGVGNVISMNRPQIIEVEELYRGRLIFQ